MDICLPRHTAVAALCDRFNVIQIWRVADSDIIYALKQGHVIGIGNTKNGTKGAALILKYSRLSCPRYASCLQ